LFLEEGKKVFERCFLSSKIGPEDLPLQMKTFSSFLSMKQDKLHVRFFSFQTSLQKQFLR